MQSDREQIRDLERIRYVTENYEQLQGLRSVPIGLLAFASGMLVISSVRLLSFGPLINDVFYYLTFLAVIGACLLYFVIADYYERRFGWVQRFSIKRKQIVAVVILIAVLLMVGSVNLIFQPPILTIWLVWGVALVAIYWRERCFRPHYIVIGILASIFSFLPLLGILRTGFNYEVGGLILFLGIFYVVGGIFDHLLLVRTMKSLPGDDGRAV